MTSSASPFRVTGPLFGVLDPIYPSHEAPSARKRRQLVTPTLASDSPKHWRALLDPRAECPPECFRTPRGAFQLNSRSPLGHEHPDDVRG